MRNLWEIALWGRLRDKSIALEGLLDIFKDRQPLLLESRNIAADAAEDFGALHTAKGSGDLLPDFCHSHILFGLVVRIGHTEVSHK